MGDSSPPRPRRSALPHLRRIAQNESFSSPQEAARVLGALFGASDYLYCIKGLREHGINPQSYIDSLDGVSPYTIRGDILG